MSDYVQYPDSYIWEIRFPDGTKKMFLVTESESASEKFKEYTGKDWNPENLKEEGYKLYYYGKLENPSKEQ